MKMLVARSEAADKCDFSTIRYAQCWEDADVLTDALEIEPEHTCLAIASAGDNALALLARSPRRVIAIDLNPAQLACLELRVAAYRALNDEELLRFVGAQPAWDRAILYRMCRSYLSPVARAFWDARPGVIECGLFSAGRFERYLATFRRDLLPHVHDRATIAALLAPKSRWERERFFDTVWDTWRWRGLFKVFFSRAVMGSLGRDPRFFDYAEGDVANHLLQRVRHAFVELEPSANPYLHWILTGTFGNVLPFSLRSENTAAIRRNLDRLSWEQCSLESYVSRDGVAIDRFALSDVFEYVAHERYAALLEAIIACSTPQARLVYWNMLAPRTRPQHLAEVLVPDHARAAILHNEDKAFFYSRLVIETAL